MDTLFKPSIWLMRRMRLLPKFALVSVLLIAPLLLVTTLLIAELQKSIALAEQERLGARYILALQDVTRLTQQHRALRHMQLSGNAAAQNEARKTQAQLDTRIAAMKEQDKIADRLAIGAEWNKVTQAWSGIGAKLAAANAKESDAQHAAMLDAIQRLGSLAADRSGLSLDAEVDSRRLMTAFVAGFPGVSEDFVKIAAHGAVYIDTGLMEPNGDVMLNAAVMGAKRDLARLPAQLDAAIADHPEWRAQLDAQAKSVPLALAFLERARDEVLNSLNQTSGNEFFAAGRKTLDALYGSAASSATLLDQLLAQRIDDNSLRRNVMLGVVLLALLAAAYLLSGFFISFPREVRQLEDAVARAASGELSQHLSSDARDEIGALSNAFGNMSRELERLVRDVRAGSDAIQAASGDIAAGNAELSARTELQASSVQQTASAMEELTVTVAQNAGNAQEASGMAAVAVDAARTGSGVVRDAVDTMNALKAGSRQILDISNVIDQIAFQTNLLALNAAVEAARAGTHGRGFAVVASEVRTLSRVSAESAKQIKTLINNSVQQIDSGSELVHSAGRSMDGIVRNVQHMAELMTRISAASAEQSRDIEQINLAIAQIDKATQENVVLVETAANGSGTLRTQAGRLTEDVAVFRLGEEVGVQDDGLPRALASIPAMVLALHPQRLAMGAATSINDDGLHTTRSEYA
jgi:methyl-accepting chemotaxis protein